MAILEERGAVKTTGFAVRSRIGKPDNPWVPLPHLGTPEGCQANYPKIHSQKV